VTWMMHIASSRWLRRGQIEDGRIDAMGSVGFCYHCFAVFYVLVPRGVSVL
jgi:hypothetical protein